MLPICAAVCASVCVLRNDNALGPLKHRICRIWTVKGDRGDEERKEDMSEKNDKLKGIFFFF